MKKLIFSFLIISFFAACNSNTNNSNLEKPKDSTLVTNVKEDIPFIALGNFEQKAAEYIGKKVQISGIVDHVCKHGGKRLFLVNDKGDVHVDSDTRFSDSLTGNELIITGIVKEFKVDEAYCLKMEEDNIKSHKGGKSNDEQFEMKKNQLAAFRDSMKVAGTDHLSFYSIDYISYRFKEE